MRHLIVLIAAVLPGACVTPALADPSIHVSPYLALYQLRGKSSLQSVGATPDVRQDNPAQRMRTFGQDRFREDVGVRADIGDGFGGLRVDYYQLAMKTSRLGMIDSDWGRLLQDDEVRIEARMDEVRLAWLQPLVDQRTEYRDEPLRLQFAAGGVFAHRAMRLEGSTDDRSREQRVDITGDVVYAAIRGRASWKDFMFDVDYAASPGLVIGGDFEEFAQDFEAKVSYQLAQRDVRFFAGYRYSSLQAEGGANGFRYDADLIIDGFQLGVAVTF